MLYHEAIRGLTAKTRGSRVIASRELDDVDRAARRAFLAAADACLDLEATARDYIVAQFARWRDASAHFQKFLIPQPHHLGTLAARVRYLQHQETARTRAGRVARVDDDQGSDKRFYVETRKLRGLARMQRRSPEDVLTEQPEQFSRDFLKHKGVWSVVCDLWDERQRS